MTEAGSTSQDERQKMDEAEPGDSRPRPQLVMGPAATDPLPASQKGYHADEELPQVNADAVNTETEHASR